MRLIAFFAALFLIAAAWNLTQGNSEDAIAGFVISGIMAGVFFLFKKEDRQSVDFLTWVTANREALGKGGALYKGILVTPETKIIRFQACFSFLVVTVKFPSRYFIQNHDGLLRAGFAYSLITLLFGWWGIPWGPIYTVQSLIKNARGGDKQTIAGLIQTE